MPIENTNTISRSAAIKILNRMGGEYGQDDIAEVMSGDAWYPKTDAEWARYLHGVTSYVEGVAR